MLLAALAVSVAHAQSLPAEEERAYEQARQEHAGRPQPALPEDVRRLKVQAEVAIREKSFEEAVGLYTQALRAAPWWAEGYHNRAVLLGELGRHADAITSMKRFLGLDPAGPAARAAQDRIYGWEFQAQRAGAERELWDSVKDSDNTDRLRTYLERYPQGRNAAQARSKIAAIEEERNNPAKKLAAARARVSSLLGSLARGFSARGAIEHTIDGSYFKYTDDSVDFRDCTLKYRQVVDPGALLPNVTILVSIPLAAIDVPKSFVNRMSTIRIGGKANTYKYEPDNWTVALNASSQAIEMHSLGAFGSKSMYRYQLIQFRDKASADEWLSAALEAATLCQEFSQLAR